MYSPYSIDNPTRTAYLCSLVKHKTLQVMPPIIINYTIKFLTGTVLVATGIKLVKSATSLIVKL